MAFSAILAASSGGGGLAAVLKDPAISQAGASILTHAYPAYKSFKAIESDEKEDDTQWLMYWTVAGAATVAEDLFALNKLPAYPFIKTGLFIWLQSGGAKLVYDKYLRQFLLKHQEQIDHALERSGINLPDEQ